jgi:hypothetical protein
VIEAVISATIRRGGLLVIGLACLCGAPVHARAQGERGAATDRPGVTPAEIQRMFEAYALVQAQEQLQVSDDKYPQFLAKFKALQDVRRRTQQERNRTLQDLRRLANEGGDENQIKERLKALQELDARSHAEIQTALEGVDSVLDVRQQARFRLFEEQMERRKIELLTRARQANRQQKR